MKVSTSIVYIILQIALIYCQFDFSSPQYQSQSRQQKANQLWAQIIRDINASSFPQGDQQQCIFFESLKLTFNFISDIFPPGRKKLIHSIGTVARARYIPVAQTPYTGFFRGADTLLIRFSVTQEPDQTKSTPEGANKNFLPGIALKYLIDGQPSSNMFAMLTQAQTQSWNFFSSDISNHIQPPSPATQRKFSTASIFTQTIGMLKLAEHTQFGQRENPVFPFRVIYRSPPNLKALFPDHFQMPFTHQISSLPVGTVIYELFAQDKPNSPEIKIGVIQLDSKATSSKFGDEQLFFQHHDMANDIQLHPEWIQSVPKFSFCTFRNLEDFEGPCPFS